VSTIEEGKLKPFRGVHPVQQRDQGNQSEEPHEHGETDKRRKEGLRSLLPEAPADGEPLAEDIVSGKRTVYDDLSSAKGVVFETMKKRGAKSSVHIPVTVGRKKMAVNFWSRDPQAFPPDAVELLSSLAQAMAEPHAAVKSAGKR
jgi:hypothetical protein